jgi:hypothetical protein
MRRPPSDMPLCDLHQTLPHAPLSRAIPVKSGSPEWLSILVFAALSDAEAMPLRLERL